MNYLTTLQEIENSNCHPCHKVATILYMQYQIDQNPIRKDLADKFIDHWVKEVYSKLKN